MDVAYVTKYTHGRLAGSLLPMDAGPSVDKLFDTLYDASLAELLNQKEAMRLYVQKMMIEFKFDDLKLAPKKFNRNYVFAVGNPKFHATPDCTFLNSDFKNYKVPAEIEALGPEKVREFQQFCEANKRELEEKSDDVFWAHVGARFRVRINPTKVSYANSGTRDVRGMTVSEIQDLVSEAIKEAAAMTSHSSFGPLLRGVRYAPHRDKALLAAKDDEARRFIASFFNLKWSVISYLFELYKKQSGAEGYVLPVNLLLAADIEPCRACLGSDGRS